MNQTGPETVSSVFKYKKAKVAISLLSILLYPISCSSSKASRNDDSSLNLEI